MAVVAVGDAVLVVVGGMTVGVAGVFTGCALQELRIIAVSKIVVTALFFI